MEVKVIKSNICLAPQFCHIEAHGASRSNALITLLSNFNTYGNTCILILHPYNIIVNLQTYFSFFFVDAIIGRSPHLFHDVPANRQSTGCSDTGSIRNHLAHHLIGVGVYDLKSSSLQRRSSR